jgi:hypothetical protein
MEDKEIDRLYALIEKGEYAQAQVVIQTALEANPADIRRRTWHAEDEQYA